MSALFPKDSIFESYTFPFFDFNFQLDHGSVVNAFVSRSDDRLEGRGRRGLYVHIPFCETICAFCPFTKSVGSRRRISDYLAALYKEIELVSQAQRFKAWRFDSVYIGGGTPSMLSPEQAEDLLEKIGLHFDIGKSAEITFEVEAKSATPELLHAVARAGATRISFGIQSLDPRLREIVNLTSSMEDIERTIRVGRELFADVNADMIVGFPGQSIGAALADVQHAISLGPTSLSLYPLDYVTVLPKLLNRMRRGDLPLPARADERWDMFHAARDLVRESFSEQNLYCFGRSGLRPCQYMFSTLYGGYYDSYLGLGCGAYTSFPGLIYHNIASELEYNEACFKGQSAVQVCSPGHAYEKSLVYFPKRLSVDLSEAEDLGLGDFVDQRLNILLREGWSQLDGKVLRLTEAGKRQYHRVMVAFMSDAQRRIFGRACQRMASDLGIQPDGALTRSPSRIRGLGSAIAMRGSSDGRLVDDTRLA